MLRGVEGVVYDDCTDRWVPHPLRMLRVSIVLRDVLPALRVTNWRIAGPYFFFTRLMLFSCYVGGALLTMVMEISIHAGVANWVFIGLIVFW